MSGVQLIRPRIGRANLAGQDVADRVVSVEIRNSIAGTPGCSLELTDIRAASTAEVKSVDQLLAQLGTRALGLQNYIDSRDLAGGPDVELEIDTGRGILEFKGWVSQASSGVGLSGAVYSVQAVGVGQAIDAIDASVYTPGKSYRQDFFAAVRDSPAALGEALVKALKAWQETTADRSQNMPEFQKEVIRQSVGVNQIAIPYLSELLQRTESPFLDEIMGQASGAKWPDPGDFLTFFFEVMSTKGKASMLNAVQGLAQAFGSEYIPGLVDSGRLVDHKTMLTQDPVVKEVEAQELKVSKSRSSMISINRVTTEAQVVRVYRNPETGSSEATPTSKVLGAFPRESAGQGVTQPVPPPPWAKEPSSLTALELAEGFDLETLSKSTSDLEEKKELTQEVARKVMDWWAEQAYLWLRLKDSKASLPSLPLDPSYEVGQRLQLTDNDGQFIGEGLISRVNHLLVLSENKIQGRTSVSLSHMNFENA